MDDGKAVSEVVDLLSGKWTVRVFFKLGKQPKTFTELNKQVDEISNKMLSETLTKLRTEGVVAEAESVDGYLLTKKGYELRENLRDLAKWSKNHSKSIGKVLIVEDDADQAELYAKWLNDFETEIVDPESVLDLSDSKPLAVIMDRYLEDQESDRFLKYISEADIPVLICTGVEPSIEDTRMPFYDYVVKPVDRSRLKESIKKIESSEKGEIRSQSIKNKKRLIESRSIGSSEERNERLHELDSKAEKDG